MGGDPYGSRDPGRADKAPDRILTSERAAFAGDFSSRSPRLSSSAPPPQLRRRSRVSSRSSSRTTSIRSRRTTSTTRSSARTDEHYDAIVILLDTPGGLSTAMNKIVKAELASKVPVIVYVSPPGSRAASAGVWISQAADLLAMAPQTNIGSSTPIDVGGGNIQSDLRRKVVNDAAASLRELARAHGRNVDWADAAVRQASNLGATEALELNVIDVIAPTLPALLEQDRRDEDGPEGHRPAHEGRGDHERRHVPLAEGPRHADRPEPDRPLHVDRDARPDRRALEPGADLPGHRRARSASSSASSGSRCCRSAPPACC